MTNHPVNRSTKLVSGASMRTSGRTKSYPGRAADKQGGIFNAVGKTISVTKGLSEGPAHLIQGVEASILKEVLDLHNADIVLLHHDGFASRKQLDVASWSGYIHEKTGYRMKPEDNQIDIPPDLNKTKL